MSYGILLVGLEFTQYGREQSEAGYGRDGSGGTSNKPDDPILGGVEVIKAGDSIPDGFGGKMFATVEEARAWLDGDDGADFKKYYQIVLLGSVRTKSS